ncbi:MAG: dephospho-CoA kinase [Clostridia bacterium]|nr:dephospho-CoA kinase [Clostridia bacterium]
MGWGGDMVVGITGSMGCGKTYASKKLNDIANSQGIDVCVINVDEVRRNILKNNADLADLYKKAYNSKKNMNTYKATMMPVVVEELRRLIFLYKQKLIFLEWALLIEDGLDILCDYVLLVSCKKSVQFKRLAGGDLPKQQIRKRIKNQFSNARKLKMIKKLKKPYDVLETNECGDEKYVRCFNNILSQYQDYSFCFFKIPQNGGRVLWEITSLCNYQCVYCIFSCSSQRQQNELSTKQAKKVIKQLKENNFSYIKFTGGEPFVRQDMIKILKYASKKGFDMDISTNASLISSKLAKQLAKIKLKYVHISLDGYNQQSHELVRGKNTFSRTINGIKKLVESGVKTRLGCLIYKNNQDHLEDVVKFAAKLQTQEIIFSFMEPIGRLNKESELISDLSGVQAENILAEIKQKYKNQIKVSYSFANSNEKTLCDTKCPALSKFMFIDNLGFVSPCTWLVDNYPQYKSEISLNNHSLKEVLCCDAFKSFKQYHSGVSKNICPAKKR